MPRVTACKNRGGPGHLSKLQPRPRALSLAQSLQKGSDERGAAAEPGAHRSTSAEKAQPERTHRAQDTLHSVGVSGQKWTRGKGRRRHWHPLQDPRLENPMDGGAWRAAAHGVAKSRTRLSGFTVTFHFHALKETAARSSVPAWRISGTRGLGGLPSMGSHGVGHD